MTSRKIFSDRSVLGAVLAASLLTLIMTSASVNAGGFITKFVSCPDSSFDVLPAGLGYTLEDVILSTNGSVDFQLTSFKSGGLTIILSVFLDSRDTVVSNFQGQVEIESGASVSAACTAPEGETPLVWLTLVGKSGINTASE